MPWLTPGSNDSGGVLDDWCQPSCVEMVEITGLVPAATARIGGKPKSKVAARKGSLALNCGRWRGFAPDFCSLRPTDWTAPAIGAKFLIYARGRFTRETGHHGRDLEPFPPALVSSIRLTDLQQLWLGLAC